MTVLARCHHDEFWLGLQLNEKPLAMLNPASPCLNVEKRAMSYTTLKPQVAWSMLQLARWMQSNVLTCMLLTGRV